MKIIIIYFSSFIKAVDKRYKANDRKALKKKEQNIEDENCKQTLTK
jgi:hypothetical protein